MTKRSVLVLVKPSAEAMARWNDDAVRYIPNCRSGCSAQNHRSYSECCQGLSINSGAVYSRDRAWNKELDSYDNAVAAGMQPAGTSQAKVDEAVRISDATGVPYRADGL
jgi:hypothetical protein